MRACISTFMMPGMIHHLSYSMISARVLSNANRVTWKALSLRSRQFYTRTGQFHKISTNFSYIYACSISGACDWWAKWIAGNILSIQSVRFCRRWYFLFRVSSYFTRTWMRISIYWLLERSRISEYERDDNFFGWLRQNRCLKRSAAKLRYQCSVK